MCVSVNIFKLEYLRNEWTNIIKKFLNHHWGGGKAALGFGPDRIGTLVSMTTDSSHRVIHHNLFITLLFGSKPISVLAIQTVL